MYWLCSLVNRSLRVLPNFLSCSCRFRADGLPTSVPDTPAAGIPLFGMLCYAIWYAMFVYFRILQSMSAPEDEGLQRAASKALLPNIDKIRTFFELSRDMEQVRRLTLALLSLSYPYPECFLLYQVVGNNR